MKSFQFYKPTIEKRRKYCGFSFSVVFDSKKSFYSIVMFNENTFYIIIFHS